MTFVETSNLPRPPKFPISDWSDDRVASLTRLWGEGRTASYIAVELGGVTRSAVIGKVHRLNLDPRRVTIRLPSLNQNRPHKRVSFVSVKPKNPVPPQMLMGEPAPNPVYSLFDLERAHCRYPYGEPGAADFHYCGGKSIKGRSYCGPHHQLAYQPKR